MKSIPPRLCGALFAATLSVLTLGTAHAAGMSSANYRVIWDVLDSGGGKLESANYTLQGSIGQPVATGASASANYVLVPGFFAPPDSDADGFRDFVDNCSIDYNPSQLDTNGDGYGNRCDADLNNDGNVNIFDLGIFRSRFLTTGPHADFDGNGYVNIFDLGIFRTLFLEPPGPSGLAP